MNFQQLRYVRETVRQGLNLTEAAKNVMATRTIAPVSIGDMVYAKVARTGGHRSFPP